MVLGRFLFTHFWCRLPIKVAKVAGTTGRTRGFQTERSFSMMHDFRQSSEALRLSQVSKMLLQLSGQISAHCSSSEIRNTLHLCLFRVFFFHSKNLPWPKTRKQMLRAILLAATLKMEYYCQQSVCKRLIRNRVQKLLFPRCQECLEFGPKWCKLRLQKFMFN